METWAVAELFARLESRVVLVTVAVLEMAVAAPTASLHPCGDRDDRPAPAATVPYADRARVAGDSADAAIGGGARHECQRRRQRVGDDDASRRLGAGIGDGQREVSVAPGSTGLGAGRLRQRHVGRGRDPDDECVHVAAAAREATAVGCLLRIDERHARGAGRVGADVVGASDRPDVAGRPRGDAIEGLARGVARGEIDGGPSRGDHGHERRQPHERRATGHRLHERELRDDLRRRRVRVAGDHGPARVVNGDVVGGLGLIAAEVRRKPASRRPSGSCPLLSGRHRGCRPDMSAATRSLIGNPAVVLVSPTIVCEAGVGRGHAVRQT